MDRLPRRRSVRASSRTASGSMLLERATGRTRSLTDDFDFWVDEFRWTPDSKALVFASQVRGRETLYRVVRRGGAPRRPSGPAAAIAGLEVAGRAHRLRHELAARARPRSGASALDGNGPAAVDSRQRRAPRARSRWARSPSASPTPPTAASSRRGSSSRRSSIRRRSTRRCFFIHGGPQGAWMDGWSNRWNPAGLGGLRLRRLRRQPAGLDGLRPGLPRRDQRRLGRPGLRRPDAAGRRPRVAALRGPRRRSARRARPTAAT